MVSLVVSKGRPNSGQSKLGMALFPGSTLSMQGEPETRAAKAEKLVQLCHSPATAPARARSGPGLAPALPRMQPRMRGRMGKRKSLVRAGLLG
jgi:hypothetical protein